MTSEKQIDANKRNASQSTGPKDCKVTRFNAVTYGLTGEGIYTKEENAMICTIYEDLSNFFNPTDVLDQILISRLAKLIWRLQRINQLEEAFMKNSLIKQRNQEKGIAGILKNEDVTDPEDEKIVEQIDKHFELLNRYEISTENRILKLIMFLYRKKKEFY